MGHTVLTLSASSEVRKKPASHTVAPRAEKTSRNYNVQWCWPTVCL